MTDREQQSPTSDLNDEHGDRYAACHVCGERPVVSIEDWRRNPHAVEHCTPECREADQPCPECPGTMSEHYPDCGAQ